MSGGVDSSVAAVLLKERGYEVIGITINLFSLPEKYCREKMVKNYWGQGAVEDARRIALTLDIPLYVVDLREDFKKKVITNFCEEYRRGRTPNPCIRCNQYIKFDLLIKKAKKLQADYIATGHYARVEYDSRSDQYLLKKGKDREKDQSYFLYALTREQLSQTLMPIGDFTKEKVREEAQRLSLPVAQRPESQEICFVQDNDYAEFLRKRIPDAFRPGPIVDVKRQVLGQHQGIALFTIGQRRGIGIAGPHPLYVLSIQSDKNTIIVGSNDHLYKKKLLASQVNLIFMEKISKPLVVKAKIRYKHREAKALLSPLDSGQILVEFDKPQRAVAPGQAVVFYEKDVVVGGGTINR